jgi:hypothetical protein
MAETARLTTTLTAPMNRVTKVVRLTPTGHERTATTMRGTILTPSTSKQCQNENPRPVAAAPPVVRLAPIHDQRYAEFRLMRLRQRATKPAQSRRKRLVFSLRTKMRWTRVRDRVLANAMDDRNVHHCGTMQNGRQYHRFTKQSTRTVESSRTSSFTKCGSN